MMDADDSEVWRDLLDRLNEPSTLEVADAVAGAFDLADDRALDAVEDALDTGTLVDDSDAGAFGCVRLAESAETPTLDKLGPEKPESKDDTPTPETEKTTILNGDSTMFDADYSITEGETHQPQLADTASWMVRGKQYPPRNREKAPFAPWNQAAQWGDEENRTTFETAKEWDETDPRSDGLAFIHTESDPFAFIDGDDVRCPETGKTHPAFRALLEHFGATYADVSTSGTGIHAPYHAPEGLPIDGKEEANFEIDTKPWGANDSPPSVEIYANTHVNITTGDHVVGTPLKLGEWDADAVRTVLEANGYTDKEPVTHDTDRDRTNLDNYEPLATDANHHTNDVRDVLAAIDKLEPRDLPLRTCRTGEDSTGWTTWDPSYRASESGESLHYNGEGAFHDHKEGEAFGVLSLFAAEENIIRNPWDRLADGDFWDAVDAAREAGVPIPEYVSTDDAEPVAAIPVAKLDVLDSNQRRRAAKKRGLNIPTTSDARERLRNGIMREMRNGNATVLDAPTALGKSYTTATEPWLRRQSVTGGAPVIQAHETKEARDQAAADTNNSMATAAVLRGRKEASPVARGDHDPAEEPDADGPKTVVTVDGEPASEWFDTMCDGKGIAFSTALAIATERNDQDLDELPPFGVEDPAVAQWGDIPRDGDGEPAADVIHCTDAFLHVPSIRTNTNIVIDEQPDFREELEQDRIRRMVNAYLKEVDAPVTNFESFVSLAKHEGHGGDAAVERDAMDSMLEPDSGNPPTEWYVENPNAHALAPGITRAIWNALMWEEPDRNGRRTGNVFHEPPRFDADGTDFAAGTWLSVVIDDDHTVQSVRATPDLRQARSVIGLDAHPSMPLWELNAAPGMTRDTVLDATERRLWRRYERGLQVVQIGDATRPRSGENARDWMNDDRVREVLKRLREYYGDGFETALTTTQVERRLRELMDEVGVDVDKNSTMHYGEEKSRDDYAEELAGYVYGCMDPGDGFVIDTLAELGLDATPARLTETDVDEPGGHLCNHCDSDGCSRCNQTGRKREKGRTFDGPDADKAKAALASVRENHVAQAAGRYARDTDGDRGATVYLHTDAAPTGFVDAEVSGVEWLATDLQKEILDELAARPSATTMELAEAVDCSKEHVRQTLTRLEQDEKSAVERVARAGEHGADLFSTDASPDAIGEIVETTNDALCDSNRWALVVLFRHTSSTSVAAGDENQYMPTSAIAGGDNPPDPAD
jgi:hypothetical protein